MEIEILTDLYNRLAFPEKCIKSIKIKRFLREIDYKGDFVDIDIFLKKANKNQNTKIDYQTFELLIADLFEKKQINGDKLTTMLNDNADSESIYIQKLSSLINLKGMNIILDKLYDNFNIVFELLSNICEDNNMVNYSAFVHFCKVFRLFPDQISYRQINRYFDLISCKKSSIDLNQFLEVILLIFLEIFNITKYDELDDFINELCVFLIRLDTSGGWDVLCKENGKSNKRYRFGQGIVTTNNS